MEEAKVVLPGDVVATPPDQGDGKDPIKLKLGPALMQQFTSDGILQLKATKFGVFHHKLPHTYWVDGSQKRANLAVGENVIGQVSGRGTDSYSVDVGANMKASLPVLAFEGATKRNRPNLEIGDLVFARVTLANNDMEPELQCIQANGTAGGLGPLVSGYMISCTTALARKLLSPNCYILSSLGKLLAFEIAVGLNGRVWIKSSKPRHTIIVANSITASEFMTSAQIDKMVGDIWREAS